MIKICKLRGNSCDESSLRHLKLPPSIHPIKNLKLTYVPTSKDNSASSNICNPESGECQHMCLLNSRSGGGSCVCYVGWERNGNQCKPRRPRRQLWWDIYMTPQPTLRPEPQPVDIVNGVPAHILVIGK